MMINIPEFSLSGIISKHLSQIKCRQSNKQNFPFDIVEQNAH
jgi:hypothetical protein